MQWFPFVIKKKKKKKMIDGKARKRPPESGEEGKDKGRMRWGQDPQKARGVDFNVLTSPLVSPSPHVSHHLGKH